MALTIQDFEDLVKLLNEHPEWRERLRSVLFPEWEEFRTAVSELLRESLALQRDVLDALRHLATRLESLTGRVDELAEAQRRTEAQLQVLAARVDDLTVQLQALTARVDDLAARVDDLAKAQKDLTVRMEELAEILRGLRGEREGEKFEEQVRRSAFGIFRGGRNFRKDVEDALERAIAEGRIDWKTFQRVRATDLLWWKKPQDQPPVLLVAEVSIQVDQHDVDRVLQTVRILTQLFPDLRVIPVVMGRDWSRPEAWEQARLRGVEWWIEKNGACSDRLDSILKARPEVLQNA